LGAGAAILLALMLKAIYPTVYCYGFGTPGSVMDATSCEEIKPYCLSIVGGNDIFCRMRFRSMCVLRNDVLEAICRAKKSKVRILSTMFTRTKASELLFNKGDEPSSKYKEEFLKFKVSCQY
jgi:hypothetical protein